MLSPSRCAERQRECSAPDAFRLLWPVAVPAAVAGLSAVWKSVVVAHEMGWG